MLKNRVRWPTTLLSQRQQRCRSPDSIFDHGAAVLSRQRVLVCFNDGSFIQRWGRTPGTRRAEPKDYRKWRMFARSWHAKRKWHRGSESDFARKCLKFQRISISLELVAAFFTLCLFRATNHIINLKKSEKVTKSQIQKFETLRIVENREIRVFTSFFALFGLGGMREAKTIILRRVV